MTVRVRTCVKLSYFNENTTVATERVTTLIANIHNTDVVKHHFEKNVSNITIHCLYKQWMGKIMHSGIIMD